MKNALNFLGRMVCIGVVFLGAGTAVVGLAATDNGIIASFAEYPRVESWLQVQHPHHMQLIIGGFIGIAIGFLCGFILLGLAGKPSTHGSAKWAGFWECVFAHLMPLHGPRFRLGRRGLQKIALPPKLQCEHVMIIAPTGQRKTTGFIEPNLYEERGERGIVTFDLKGELYKACGGALSKYLKVIAFAPMDLTLSMHYNPLRHIMTEVDAEDLAACWIENTGLAPQQYWNDTAKLLVQATILHLVDCEPGAPFSRLADLLSTTTFDEVRQLFKNSKSQRAQRIGKSFLSNAATDPAMAGKIMTGMAARFLMMHNPDVRQLTANDSDLEHNLDLHHLATDPQALFLIIPVADITRLKPLTAALLMQLMNHLTRNPQERGVVFYLDELGNAGRIPNYPKQVSLVRGQNLALFQVIQDFGQLQELYGTPGMNTILNNSLTKVFLPGLGKQESEYASDLAGEETVKTPSYSHQRGYNGREQISYNRRRLMYPDEIRRMKRGTALIFTGNVSPIKARFKPSFKRRRYRRLAKLPLKSYAAPNISAPPSPKSAPATGTAPASSPPSLPPAPHTP